MVYYIIDRENEDNHSNRNKGEHDGNANENRHY